MFQACVGAPGSKVENFSDLRNQRVGKENSKPLKIFGDYMFGEICEMHPLLTLKLTNATIKRAVDDYLNGGAMRNVEAGLGHGEGGSERIREAWGEGGWS